MPQLRVVAVFAERMENSIALSGLGSMMPRLGLILWKRHFNATKLASSLLKLPFVWVLRGFQCVPEYLRLLRSNDLRAAKTAFIPSFVDELKEQSGPEVAHLIAEAENLLVERQGWVLLGGFSYRRPFQ